MRLLVRVILGIVVLALVVGGIGYLVLRRGDIDYATLKEKYANEHSRYVALGNGVEMHYRDQGQRDGPVLLLVHGFSASLYTWEPIIAVLGGAYRIVTLDLPGHGLTQAPANYAASTDQYVADVEAFAASQTLTRFAIGGSSMGGGVAWNYALAHPERVEALILVDAAGWPAESARSPPLVFQLMQNPIARAVLKDLDSSALIRDGLQGSFADPAHVDDAMVTRYAEMARAPGHRDILLSLQGGGRRLASNETLAGVKAPTLILWGEEDHLIPVGDARKFAAAIAGSELVIWPDDGHLPQEEHPERTAAAIDGFLTRVRAAQSAEAPAAVTSP